MLTRFEHRSDVPVGTVGDHSEKFVSHAHRFIYVAVPKVASQTSLQQIRGHHQHLPPAAWLETRQPIGLLLTEQPALRDYFKFSYVRHPFSRAVSCYVEKMLDPTPSVRRMCENWGMPRIPQSFAEFVDFLCSPAGSDAGANPHWGSQASLLTDGAGRPFVDAVGRLERFAEDSAAIARLLGLDGFKPKWKNPRPRPAAAGRPVDDEAFWTPELAALIHGRYEADYRLFGYDPQAEPWRDPLPEPQAPQVPLAERL